MAWYNVTTSRDRPHIMKLYMRGDQHVVYVPYTEHRDYKICT